LSYIKAEKHHQFRHKVNWNLAAEFAERKLSPIERSTELLIRVLKKEKAVILPEERIIGLRTVSNLPEIYTDSEWEELSKEYYIHEKGYVCNICPDYATIIKEGLEKQRSKILVHLENGDDNQSKVFYNSLLRVIEGIGHFSDKYLVEAKKTANHELIKILEKIPRNGAGNFHEALQFFRLIHFSLWTAGNYHNTIGRFDQYIFPYLKKDLELGNLDYESAFELLEEFFISFNKDSDLYPGIQQGDNGQSMILGGIDKKGNDSFNLLSEMCLKASRELKLIDPKINLRVHKDTEMKVFKLGTSLTREGLGFPQYSNDQVVIPGLVDLGYELEDARDYTVAACWEFIIPGSGMDIPNIEALSFVKVVDRAVHCHLKRATSFQEFMGFVEKEINEECEVLIRRVDNVWMIPAPLISLLMDDCLDQGRDISLGNKYNNYGIHGTGLATAADSLAVIKKYIFEEGSLRPDELITCLDANFQGYEEYYTKFKYRTPQMGNDDNYVDEIGVFLLDKFRLALKGKKNKRGGSFRAGTGSAMYYLRHAAEIGASPSGRLQGEPFEANYSPSLSTKVRGPVSVIKSFSKPDLRKTINGGPLTIELHDSVFSSVESSEKVAMLVKSFMDMGGHQLQLNAVNRDQLIAAQKEPDKYRNLIVRVWGWSAYFIELDKEYQDHIIKRTEMTY